MKELVRHPYFYPATTTLWFVLAIFTGVLPLPNPDAGEIGWVALGSKSLLALGFLFLAAWFLHAFTHADPVDTGKVCQAEQRASMFRFAYLFSLFSFALLVLPFTAMLRTHDTPPDAGPIRLLRACVQPQPAARPASGVGGPVEFCPGSTPAGRVGYPWLVSVGGVVSQECDSGEFRCSKPIEIATPAGTSAAGAASTPALAKGPILYSVSGGFVVPFYVVVFAFVGGVVNLTRRVPEYQKRSACSFIGTPTESQVSLLEAREFVVFQIMQLMSSPFVAMVAYYALEPKSIASAVGLAFVSGFATESVLLLIRGMVNGLRPETTKTTASTLATTARLHIKLVRAIGASVDQAKLELRSLPNASSPLKAAVADATGEFDFPGLAAGTLWVVATLDVPGVPPTSVTATQKVDLKAGQTESITLTLA
jgi:hypothetical protein